MNEKKSYNTSTKYVCSDVPSLTLAKARHFEKSQALTSSLTYEKISEKMLKMKVIQNFVLINVYIIHFIDKVCWTELFFI